MDYKNMENVPPEKKVVPPSGFGSYAVRVPVHTHNMQVVANNDQFIMYCSCGLSYWFNVNHWELMAFFNGPKMTDLPEYP